MPPAAPPEILTPEDVASILRQPCRRPVRLVRRLERQGLVVCRIGRAVRVRREDLEAFILARAACNDDQRRERK